MFLIAIFVLNMLLFPFVSD